MKYTPVQPPEGINVSDEHPLKSFFILSAGTIGLVFGVLLILSLVADFIVGYIPVEYERSLFENQNLGELIAGTEGETSAEVEAYLQQLVDSLHQQADNEYQDHQFKVSLSPMMEPNAFAAPGGHIIVTTGLLNSIESENGLAMVLAHEIGHHYERHPLRGMGRGIVVGLFLITLSGFDGAGLAESFLGQTTLIGQLAYSRKQETDADKIGVDLLTRHYQHASGASEFFAYIEREGLHEHAPPAFLSTHPSPEKRLEYLSQSEQQKPGKKTPLPQIVLDYIDT